MTNPGVIGQWSSPKPSWGLLPKCEFTSTSWGTGSEAFRGIISLSLSPLGRSPSRLHRLRRSEDCNINTWAVDRNARAHAHSHMHTQAATHVDTRRLRMDAAGVLSRRGGGERRRESWDGSRIAAQQRGEWWAVQVGHYVHVVGMFVVSAGACQRLHFPCARLVEQSHQKFRINFSLKQDPCNNLYSGHCVIN